MTQFKSIKRRKNDRQFIWEYMRRNRIFKIEDLLTIVDGMSLSAMKDFFKQLEHAGFIKVRIPLGKKTKPKKFIDRTYGFIKNTGPLCPVWISKQKRLYDRNTQEVQIKDPIYAPKESKKIEHRPVDPMDYDKGRIVQILESEPEGLDLLSLSERCGLPAGRFAFVLTAMQLDDTVKEIDKVGGVPILQLREVKNVS